FFQAEDGIRDATVTGVQTCALPIFGLPPTGREILNSVFLQENFKAGLDLAIVNSEKIERFTHIAAEEIALCMDLIDNRGGDPVRSEERRVGKGSSWRL